MCELVIIDKSIAGRNMSKSVTESARERETFRYYPSLLHGVHYNDRGTGMPNSALRTSKDASLTALAQLGAIRTRTARSLVSLFDQDNQYIIAEATPKIPLAPSLGAQERNGEELWLCGTAIPRRHGVCEYTLLEHCTVQHPGAGFPLTVVDDLGADPLLSEKPYCVAGSPARFYAAVPLRTTAGINVGVYCVIHDEPITGSTAWQAEIAIILSDIAKVIMAHLDSHRIRDEHRRSQRMVRGISSFVEDESTLSGWSLDMNAGVYQDILHQEGGLNREQQQKVQQRIIATPEKDSATTYFPDPSRVAETNDQANASRPMSNRPGGKDLKAPQSTNITPSQHQATTDTPRRTPELSAIPNTPESRDLAVRHIFSKAANIIRESVEVEGAVFFDAARVSPDARSRAPSPRATSPRAPNSSSDEATSFGTADGHGQLSQPCRLLGFSNSDTSSINLERMSPNVVAPSLRFLRTLARRYPQGKIYVFNQNGDLQTSDSSGDDLVDLRDKESFGPPPSVRTGHGSRSWSRHLEGTVISKCFPRARSVAFLPMWDDKKQRWLSGGFVYTQNPTRLFARASELSYLRAFCTQAVYEVHRLDTNFANQAQMDVLGSISHEMRSPLHGIILGLELLNDTPLDTFQGNISHTLETCGRTLLDTVNHLLDFSQINNYIQNEKSKTKSRSLRKGGRIEAGMQASFSEVSLDALVEEVAETVFAGHNFQRMSVGQLDRADKESRIAKDVMAHRTQDTRNAMESLGQSRDDTGYLQIPEQQVAILLDIQELRDHRFHAAPGALRRIVMNLFGNALKYTPSGMITVSLSIDEEAEAEAEVLNVRLVVADTGIGMSEDYLHNDLYRPFAQEDFLKPGSGLGLSLVKKIVTTLKGHISIKSHVGRGTVATVLLPLRTSNSLQRTRSSENNDPDFENQRRELSGLRICSLEPAMGIMEDSAQQLSLKTMCQQWLEMQVLSGPEAKDLAADLIICDEAVLRKSGPINQKAIKPPIIVVCPDALVAHRRTADCSYEGGDRVLEFISQPVGPRKIAKVFVLALRRWANQQSALHSAGSTESLLTLAIRPSMRQGDDSPDSASQSPESSDSTPLTTPASEPTSTESLFTPSASPIAEDLEVPPPPAQPVPAASPSTPPTCDFLLVDDNPINLKILCVYMKKLGCGYSTATDGQDALDNVKANPGLYKCILMDINMPRLDGMEATRLIRAAECKQKQDPAAIFALSGLASEDAQQRAYQSGIDLFLTKPVKLKELSDVLSSKGLI